MIACVAFCGVAAASPSVAGARTAELQKNREKARELAADVTALDVEISAAVESYSRATTSLEAVRRELRDNKRIQRMAYKELALARTALAARAVSMYKHGESSALDAVFGAADISDLVTQLTMVQRVARSDRDVLRMIEETKRELADRAVSLKADERTAARLVAKCKADLAAIRARLDERRAMLAGVRSDIARLAEENVRETSSPGPTVTPPSDDEGSGPWWPLIQGAAASNGVSARGMYRLMMIESGGSASIVGPGGYYGLYQYAPSTWKGDWNPYRSSSITDGSAQIKATALAIHLGYGHAWWDPSYTWAFQGR